VTDSPARVKVHSLPDCSKCEELKRWLTERGIGFEARWFDSEAQTEFVMRNMFGNPPFLEVGERAASSEELFRDGALNEAAVREVLGV